MAVNHLLQLLAAAAMEVPAGGDPETLKGAQTAIFRAVATADPASTSVASTRATGPSAVSPPTDDRDVRRCGSTSRTGAGQATDLHPHRDRRPVTQTEMRLVFKQSPGLGFHLRPAGFEPDRLIVRLDPSTGVRLLLITRRADDPHPAPIHLDMEFAEAGGEGPTPYEVLLHAAMIGQNARFSRQDTIEEAWRIMQPLIDQPPTVHTYAPGSGVPRPPMRWSRTTAAGANRGFDDRAFARLEA